ncbi:hypothetical protein [Paenibacillus tengchongensis]|uniref:hypothetical protein n=1 Tax=Paenibacillus tengchongensis TaxID=2608684 RepID=UPI00124DCCFD|nr:hypothetical protein [Paenibacillus tengchongensis]
MSVLLQQQPFTLDPLSGSSYYEDLTGGSTAAVTVINNFITTVRVEVLIVNRGIVNYLVPAFQSLTLKASPVLYVGLFNTDPVNPATGFLTVATSVF